MFLAVQIRFKLREDQTNARSLYIISEIFITLKIGFCYLFTCQAVSGVSSPVQH